MAVSSALGFPFDGDPFKDYRLSMSQDRDYSAVKQQLNAISPAFCLAKWKQVTVHLHNGQTHSCHHPNTHKIPVEELAQNPSALHNTVFKKQQRKMMLEGKRPPECEYCWRIEDLPGEHVSDRVIKSSDPWALPELQKIAAEPFDRNVNPSYLEVSFSNACNFRCSYCYPHFSSRWMSEVKEHGPYQLSYPHHLLPHLEAEGKMPFEREEANPYVDAFWKWWPALYPELKVLRVTGGEPLLSPSTFRILDEIIAKPNPDLELAINSNLGSNPAVIDRFLEKLGFIAKNRLVRMVRLYTSVDTWGSHAEYIRNGLDFQSYWGNLERVVRDFPDIHTTIMCTFNSLSVPAYREFLEGFVELKRKHRSFAGQHTFMLDISYLMNPPHQSVIILPKTYLELKLRECARFIDENMLDEKKKTVGFSQYEKVKFMRLLDYALSVQPRNRETLMSDFFRFFSEHDRRRGTNFTKTFPEFRGFWQACREEAGQLVKGQP
jgi:Radical SAM superfamily